MSLKKTVIIAGLAASLNKIIGFAREAVLAAFYGTSSVSDAFILAFTIPDFLLVFFNASLTASFIPMYHRVKDTTKFTRNVMTLLLVVGLLISMVFAIFPNVLIRLFAFRLEPVTFDLAVLFVRFMIWVTVFTLLTEVFNAYLEIKGDFFSAGIRNIWRNSVIIIGLILGALTGFNLIVAIAPIAGNALCMFALSRSCRKRGYVYKPYLDLKSPELKQMLILIAPVILSSIFTELHVIISRNFAAALPTGSVSVLNYSVKIQGFFIALIGQAILIVLYPHMSKLAAESNMEALKNMIAKGTVYITAIMLPLSVGVFVLAQPIVKIIFQRGSFQSYETTLTASCLRMYSVMIFTNSLIPVFMRTFHSIQKTKAPAYISIVTACSAIMFNFILVGPLKVQGLALSASLSSVVMLMLLIIFLRKRIGELGLVRNLPEILKLTIASGIMGCGVWFAAGALPFAQASLMLCIVYCAALAAGAAAVYAALLWLMRSSVAIGMAGTAFRIIAKRRGRL